MDAALRPMSTSQVLDRTFHLYRNNFVLFAGITIVAPGLSLLAGFVQLGVFGLPVMPQPGAFDPGALQKLLVQSVIGAILGLIFYAIGQALATGATMHAVSMVHLGKTTTIQESYRTIKPIFWSILRIIAAIFLRAFSPLVLAYVLLFAIAFAAPGLVKASAGPQLGLALLIVLGGLLSLAAFAGGVIWAIYAYTRYALAIPACVLEKLTPKASLIRSKFLSNGSLGRIMAVYLLTAVMAFVLSSVLQIPAYIFGGNIFSLKGGAQISSSFVFWTYLGSFLGRTLAGPIATIAIALVYYDQRVRKEAFDLQLMMQSLEPMSQAHAASSSSLA